MGKSQRFFATEVLKGATIYTFSLSDALELLPGYPKSSVVECPPCGGSGRVAPDISCPLCGGDGQAVRIPKSALPGFSLFG